jgi:nitrogen fixation/metabolism regulation signal transduction histidine kinase
MQRRPAAHLRGLRRHRLLMLLAAVWLAILFATRLTEPIGG